MVIQSRFEFGAETGYIIEEMGMTYPVPGMGLYNEMVAMPLMESGYKYLNYHGDVLDPQGINISTYVAMPYTVSEDDMQGFKDMANDALTESQMARYFENITSYTAITFKEPVSIEIKTREELVSYLEKVRRMKSLSKVAIDVRPINSFVSKEALFKVEELSDDYIRGLYEVIVSRREFYSRNDYKLLVNFLQKQGLLKAQFDYGDFLQAYNAWGPCGLQTDVVNKKINLTSSSDIVDTNRVVPESMIEKCLLSKDNVVYYSKGTYDFSEVEDFTDLPIRPLNVEVYRDTYHKRATWKTEFAIIDCSIVSVRPVLTYEMITDEGTVVRYSIDDRNVVIADARRKIYYGYSFMLRCYEDSLWALADILTDESYTAWNFALAKAKSLFREQTVTPPVHDSFSLIIDQGVGPTAAVDYIARQIFDDPNRNLDYQTGVDYVRAATMYTEEIDEALISKYNPEKLSYETKDELIEIMLNTREALVQNNSYLVVDKDDLSESSQQIKTEIGTRPLENLAFAKSVKDREVTIDYLAEGIKADGEADVAAFAKLLITMATIENDGAAINSEMIGEKLNQIEESNLANIYDAVGKRVEAFRGYLKDIATLNTRRAKNSADAFYVTKVFYEITNQPVAERRHYMMEVLHMQLSANFHTTSDGLIRDDIASQIENQMRIQRQHSKLYREFIRMNAHFIAVEIMFKVAFKQYNFVNGEGNTLNFAEIISPDKDTQIEVPISINREIYNRITAPTYFEKRYVTLSDYCKTEMSDKGAFNHFCVNANVNPWRVTPKMGGTLQAYSSALGLTLDRVYDGFKKSSRDRICELNARPISSLASKSINLAFPRYNEAEVSLPGNEADNWTVELLNLEFNNPSISENPVRYYTRFRDTNNESVAKGRSVVSIPTKSDLYFAEFAESLGEVSYSEVTYKDSIDHTWLTSYEPVILGNIKVIANTNSVVERFNPDEYAFDYICRWHNLITGKFIPKGICLLQGDTLTVVTQRGRAEINLAELKTADAEALVQKEIFYKLKPNSYLFEVSGKRYTVEVK